MSWAEIKKAVNSDLSVPLNEQIEQYEIDGRRCYKKVLLQKMPLGLRENEIPLFSKYTGKLSVILYPTYIARAVYNNMFYAYATYKYYYLSNGTQQTGSDYLICRKALTDYYEVADELLYLKSYGANSTPLSLFSDGENVYFMTGTNSVSAFKLYKANVSAKTITEITANTGNNSTYPKLFADGNFYYLASANSGHTSVNAWHDSIYGSVSAQTLSKTTANYYQAGLLVSFGEYIYLISPYGGTNTVTRFNKNFRDETTMPNVTTNFNGGYALTYKDEIHLFAGYSHFKGDGSTWTQLRTTPNACSNAYIINVNGQEKIIVESSEHTYCYDEVADTWDEIYHCEPSGETYVYEDGTLVE